jgi:hypothetical protein
VAANERRNIDQQGNILNKAIVGILSSQQIFKSNSQIFQQDSEIFFLILALTESTHFIFVYLPNHHS